MPAAQLPGVIRHLGLAVAARGADDLSDSELLERFLRERDKAAFELLVWRHGKMVLGTCRRLLRDAHEAEDAFQATFLTLARRGASIGRRESVGGWLHKVAYRVALGVSARRVRRDSGERSLWERAQTVSTADPAAEAARREVERLLDEEISRLPDIYRVPFVLCCLEGRTNADVAGELGCAVGTVESRLSRARRRLRARLTRRGVTLSTGLGAALVGSNPAPAFVPATLVSGAAKAASQVTGGDLLAAGLVSAPVIEMTEGVIRAMWMTKLKAAAAIVMAVTLAGTGTGVLAFRPASADQPRAAESPATKTAPAVSSDHIARLIEQLTNESFTERDKATKELDRIGAPALDALRKAARTGDAEQKRRAVHLVKAIEARVESANLLAPKRLRLVYKNTPLEEAVADFRKKSGYEIVLSDPDGKLKNRTVTLDTGDVTFWRALGEFCSAAGLVESPTGPRILLGGNGGVGIGGGIAGGFNGNAGGIGGFAGGGGGGIQGIGGIGGINGIGGGIGGIGGINGGIGGLGGGQGIGGLAGNQGIGGGIGGFAGNQGIGGGIVGGGGAFGGAAVVAPPSATSGRITLTDGKAATPPTDARIAVRVRALENADRTQPQSGGEILLNLEVAPEPRLRWQRTVAVSLRTTIDDQGQTLQRIIAAEKPGEVRPGPAGVPINRATGGAVVVGSNAAADRLIGLRLKRGSTPSTSLRELSGTITAELLTEAKRCVIVDNIAKAAGKTVHGDDESAIGVIDVKDANGHARVRFTIVPPAHATPAGGFDRVSTGEGRVTLRGGDDAGAKHELAIVDDQGARLSVLGAGVSLNAGGSEYTIVCQSKDDGRPIKLLYTTSPAVTIDVPFTLRNIPLP